MSPKATDSGTARDLVARFWKQVWNPPYSMAAFDELVADDFSISTDGRVIEGKEAFRAWLQAFQSRISHLRTQPEEILVAEDGRHVTTRMRVSGLNEGLFGNDGSDKQVIIAAAEGEEAAPAAFKYPVHQVWFI